MADLVKLLFRLPQDEDGWPPYEVEGVWSRPQGNDFVVENLPFFVRGLAFEDRIRVDWDDHGDVIAFEVLEPAPYSMVWVLFPNDDTGAPELRDALRALGCEVEWFRPGQQWWLLSTAVPLKVLMADVDALLEPYVAEGRAEAADGCIRHADDGVAA